MNQEQSDISYLKLKIKKDSPNVEVQTQDFTQIRIIKQIVVDQSEKNQNIENLQEAISNLYYAIYSIKDKRNLSMLQQININFNQERPLITAIRNLIQVKYDFIKQLGQNEQKKYKDVIDWTFEILNETQQIFEDTQNILDEPQNILNQIKQNRSDQNKNSLDQNKLEARKEIVTVVRNLNIFSQQHELADFFLQIKQVVLQLKKIFIPKHKSHIVVLLQNQNKKLNKFLYTFCIIQNLQLDYDQDTEQNISSSQPLKLDDDGNNENQQELDHRQKRNMYINITSDIKQQDINIWSVYMKDYKENNQLLILYPLNQDNQSKLDQKEFKLKNNTRNEIIIPIIYQKKVDLYQIKMFYKSILDQKIQNFNPNLIVLEYLLSEEFKLDLYALEYIIRQLQKRAKLIIHFRISSNNNYTLYELQNNLNAIVMGLQGFKSLEKKFINEIRYEQIVNWTFKMISIFNESIKNSTLYLQTELQLIQIQNQNFKKIFGCFSNKNTFQWIESENSHNQSYQHFVFEEVIVLCDKTNGEIYYYDRKLQNSDQDHLQIKFEKIELNQLIEPSIIVLQNYLIIAYGHVNTNEFSNKIYLYDLNNQCQNPIVMDRDTESNNLKPIYCDNKNQEQIANKINNRRGPQICKNNLFDLNNKDFLSFILIGGEEKGSNLIMNIIEIVILNLKNQKFCSYIVNSLQLSKVSSLKPWPYQVVLEGKQQNSCFYLVLNGNQTKKQNYFSFPKNPQYLKQAQLLVQQQNSFQLFVLPIKPMQQLIISIDELFDDCKCQYFDQKQSENNCFVWKLLITRFVFIENSIIIHPQFERFKNLLQSLKGNAFLQVCFQVQIKLILQASDSKPQNYTDSHVEVDCQILEIQKKIFD